LENIAGFVGGGESPRGRLSGHFLNAPMSRRERRASARKADKTSDASGALTPAALYLEGLAHMQAGRFIEAQVCGQKALAIAPDDADAAYLMGLLASETGQHDHAVAWLSRAIGQYPKVEYVSSLGHALQRAGRLGEASEAFDRLVRLKPDYAEGWNNLANVLFELQRSELALSAYRHVLELNPHYANAAFRCGLILRKLRRSEEALSYFNRCDELHQGHAAVLEQRGLTLYDLKRFEEALADQRRVHALTPNSPDICNSIGISLHALGRDGQALPWFDKAIGLKPDFVVALLNKALALKELRRLDEAVAIYRHVRAIDPDNADAEWNLALLLLMTGDFEAGWAAREVRWKGPMRPESYPHFSAPMWLGETDIDGKTVLVQEDEGLGDTLQFARYVPMLAARGARVVLVVRDAVYPLLSGLSGVAQCVPKSAKSLPAFDLHCPICSLPRAFATRLDTIPSEIPYLPAPSQSRMRAWESRIGPREKLLIGLVWSGNPEHGNDHNRSIPLKTLSPLLDVDATFVSLQKDPRPDDKTILARTGIIDLTAHLTDFAETAALIACLDLVITVDTSVAHLSGALGRPTWTLLPYIPDYRWLLDRDDSPWYPTMRLFRQTQRSNWAEVVERVRSELQQRAGRVVRA
jgi:tetratricopeptide (TPR) repeat protein